MPPGFRVEAQESRSCVDEHEHCERGQERLNSHGGTYPDLCEARLLESVFGGFDGVECYTNQRLKVYEARGGADERVGEALTKDRKSSAA